MAGSFLDFGSLETGSGGSDGEDEKPRRAPMPRRSRKFPPPEMDPEMIPELRSLLVKYKPRSLTHAKAILKEAWDGIPRSEIPRKESAYINFVTKMNPKVAKKYRALKWTNKERMDHIASLWNKGITNISEEEAESDEGEAESDKDEDEAEESEEDKDEAEQSEEEHGEDEEEIMVDGEVEEQGEVEEHGEVEEEILVEEELPVLPVLPFKTTKQEKHKKKEEKERKKEKKERKKEKKERKKEKKEKKAKKEKSSESESESESEPEQELFKKRKFEATKM
jgi:chemotaxis protein histidine kinase CheA